MNSRAATPTPPSNAGSPATHREQDHAPDLAAVRHPPAIPDPAAAGPGAGRAPRWRPVLPTHGQFAHAGARGADPGRGRTRPGHRRYAYPRLHLGRSVAATLRAVRPRLVEPWHPHRTMAAC